MLLGDVLISVLTSSVPRGSVQENSGLLFIYHFVWSGCVDEVIVVALSSETVSVVGSVSEIGNSEDLTPIFTTATREPVKIFAPVPSFAKTEPEEKLKFAVPAIFALNVIVRILPLAPVNPGLSTMPSKLTVPTLFENDGSCTQRENIDPVFEMETTSNLSHGKEMIPEAAFIAWSELPT